MTDSTADDRLKGWKEIAAFLHTSDRTVQRWERQFRLPVSRVRSARRGIVFASRRDVDAWLASSDGHAALSEPVGDRVEPASDGPIDSSAVPLTGITKSEVVAPIGAIEARMSVFAAAGPRWLPVYAIDALKRRLRPAMLLAGTILVVAGATAALSGRRELFDAKPKATAAGRGLQPSHARPARSPTVLLTFANGATARIAVTEGPVTTVRVPNVATLAVSATVESDTLELHVYRVSTAEREGDPELLEIGIFRLSPHQRQPLPDGLGLQAMEWVDAAGHSAK
jgi:hypothetical protein